jgi:Xaa-Pro dipeptidase
MEAAGIDVLLATSKHNVQYLLGGYKFIFFAAMDAIGHSRYLPVVIYAKGAPDRAAYVGNRMEGHEQQVNPFWTPSVFANCWGSVDAAKQAAAHLKSIGLDKARIGLEPGFVPHDAWAALQAELGSPTLVDATHMLERLRMIKTPAELAQLKLASELITDSGRLRQPARGLVEGGYRRAPAPRGNQSRPDLRVCAADARAEP